MNIKEFIGKYKIIVVLVAMIIILAFVKSYFGKKIDDSNSETTPIPTITKNSDGSTTTKTSGSNVVDVEKSNDDKENNLQNTDSKKNDEQDSLLNNGLIVSNEKTDNRRKELTEKSRTYQTEEEYSNWFETLSFEDQQILEGYNVVQVSQLTEELPYEGNTFIVKSVISNSVIQVKSKIDDLEKVEVDVRDWLSSKGMDFDNLVISWE